MEDEEMEDVSQIYDQNFYNGCILMEYPSSYAVAKILIRHFHPKSVIDLGCGCGIYLKALYDLGVEDVTGYDGSQAAIEKSLLPGKIMLTDLRKPFASERKYDLCLCMEVAEHLESCYADGLIQSITQAADTLFFTAATPGQGGTHHYNEQPREYWLQIFKKYGFRLDPLTTQIMTELQAENVIFWIAQNAMILRKEQA